MRRFPLSLAAALFSLAGCQMGQPRVYRVAVDVTPIKALQEPQCFRANMPPSNVTVQEQNYRSETSWVVWDGAEAKQFMDMGLTRFTLGDSPEVVIDDLIEGADRSFTATRVRTLRSSITELEKTIVIANWNDLGASPVGTLDIDSSYQCADGTAKCPNEPNKRSCKQKLNFWARKVEVNQTTGYTSQGGGLTVSTD